MTKSTSLNTAQGARDISYGVVQAITRTVNFDTLGIGTADTVKVGTLPTGAQVLESVVRVTAAFNAVTTNVLTVGSAGSNNNFVSASDVDETTIGTTIVVAAADLAFSADTPIYARYTQSGTAATTGSAVITITYVATTNG